MFEVVISTSLIYFVLYGVIANSVAVALFSLFISYICFIFLLVSFNLDILGLIIFLVYTGGVIILFFFSSFLFETYNLGNTKTKLHKLNSLAIIFSVCLMVYIIYWFVQVFIGSNIEIKIYLHKIYNLIIEEGSIICAYNYNTGYNKIVAAICANTFTYSSFFSIGLAMYTVFCIVIYNISLLFVVIVFGINLLTPPHIKSKHTTSIFFLVEYAKIYNIPQVGWKRNAVIYGINLADVESSMVTDHMLFLVIGLLAFSIPLIGLPFLGRSTNIFFKFLIFLEFMFLGIMSLLVFFSLVHSDLGGIIFILFLLSIFVVESIIGLLLFIKFKIR